MGSFWRAPRDVWAGVFGRVVSLRPRTGSREEGGMEEVRRMEGLPSAPPAEEGVEADKQRERAEGA
jgi:hypothetical protein